MKFYNFLRKVHLYVGLAILSFVIMYFITGYVLIHQTWLPKPAPEITIRTESLNYTGPLEPAAFSNYLQETFGLRGKSTRRWRLKDGGWEFRYSRPGTFHEVVVPPREDSVRITTRKDNMTETLIAFHELHGYGGGRLYTFWALLHDLASVSLIVFAFTGIYLWYKLTKKKLVGWICLGISYGYAAITFLYLMYAP